MRCAVFSLTNVDIDHMVPLSYILNLPLIVTDPKVLSLCQKYYPQVKPVFIDQSEFSIKYIAQEYDVLLHTYKPWAARLVDLVKITCNKRLFFIYCPHGNSDKLYTYTRADHVTCSDIQLVYGEQMKSYIKKHSVTQKDCPLVEVGNYRYEFYKRYQKHFDTIATREIFSRFEKPQKTILYSPTWKDPYGNSSFLDQFSSILTDLPAHYNLLIKIHPNLEDRHPAHVHHLMQKCEAHPNVLATYEFTPIYPLLNLCDIFLGDYSSVGYDFLSFKKPQFFYQQQPTPLHECGYTIPSTNPFTFIDQHPYNDHERAQETLYKHAFGTPLTFEETRKHFFQEVEKLEQHVKA